MTSSQISGKPVVGSMFSLEPHGSEPRISFDITTNKRTGARPSHNGKRWEKLGPVCGIYTDDCRSADPSAESVMGSVLRRLTEITELAKQGKIHSLISQCGDQAVIDKYTKDVEYLQDWKKTLPGLADCVNYNKCVSKHWNDIVSTAFEQITKGHDLEGSITVSINDLESLDESDQKAWRAELDIPSEEIQHEILKRCIRNVKRPCVWAFAGSRRDFEKPEYNSTKDGSLYNISRVIGNDSKNYSFFPNHESHYRVFTVLSNDGPRNNLACQAIPAFTIPLCRDIKERLSDMDRQNSIKKAPMIHISDDDEWTKGRDEYVEEQVGLIESRDEELRKAIGNITQTHRRLHAQDVFDVNVLSGLDYHYQKHSLNRSQETDFLNRHSLPLDLEVEYERITGRKLP